MSKLSRETLNEIEDDVQRLHRLKKYEVTDRHLKVIKHFMEKSLPEKRDEFTKNYIQGLIAAAVMDYDNHYHRGRPDIKTWFTE